LKYDFFPGKIKILVIGDLMLDHYIFGKVVRISPEAPVPVVDVHHETDMLGGCGNVIQNLFNLGTSVSVLSAVCDDYNGGKILDKLTKMEIATNSIFYSSDFLTNYKMRIVANNQHVVRADWGNSILPQDIEKSISDLVEELINEVNGIIISDYGKGVCTDNILKETISKANNSNKPVFVDPKGTNWTKYSGATFITPNIKEASVMLNQPLRKNSDYEAAGLYLIDKYNIKNCLITRGSEGMSLINNSETFHIPTISKEVFDISGAGDTVIACLAVAILNGVSVKEAVEFANNAAGIVVGHVGTAAISREELNKL